LIANVIGELKQDAEMQFNFSDISGSSYVIYIFN